MKNKKQQKNEAKILEGLDPEFVTVMKKRLEGKGLNLFSQEQRDLLAEYRQRVITNSKAYSPYLDETQDVSPYELQLWAMGKTLSEIPMWQQNLFLTRLMFPSTSEMAKNLGVCRQTLTNLLVRIKTVLKKEATKTLKRWQ